jgi:hypothetical protein
LIFLPLNIFSEMIKEMSYPMFIYGLLTTYHGTDEIGELIRSTLLPPSYMQRHVSGSSTYANGLLHSFNDQPAVDNADRKEWYSFGMLHRDHDQPAQIFGGDGPEIYFFYGELHRANGIPVVSRSKYTKYTE